jgi:hypothetical protein
LRSSRGLVIALGVLGLSSSASAFNSASQFFDTPGSPHAASYSASAEGIYFTGAPRYAGQTCAACHINGPGQLGVHIGADPPSLFTDGYQPGSLYELQVDLDQESAGLQYSGATCTEPLGPKDTYAYHQCNNNNFVLEMDSVSGPLIGGFCALAPVNGACPTSDVSGADVVVAPGQDAVFGNQVHSTAPGMQKVRTDNGRTRWRFWWRAPGPGAGPITLFVGAVDGNGGGGISTDDEGPYDDDTVSAQVTLQEWNGSDITQVSAGCASAGRAAPDWAAFGLVFAGLLGTIRRRRGISHRATTCAKSSR